MKIEPFKPDTYYHVYNRGNDVANLFREDENYHYFLKLLQKYLLPIAEIYSYCLLPNHFHLVLKLKDESQLPEDIVTGKRKISQPFSNFFNAYAKAYNKRYKRRGSLFQEHLKRKKIDSTDYLQKLILYVNTNADHHGFGSYKHYPYSSYHLLISEKSSFVNKEQTTRLFDTIENFKYTIDQKRVSITSKE